MSVAEILDDLEYGPAPESDAEARAWLAQHAEGTRFSSMANGGSRASGQWFDTLDPATGEVLARVAQADGTDVDAAVAAARHAQKRWATLLRTRAGALSLRHRPADPEKQPPLRGDRGARQRKADPRDPRHRRAAGRPAFLSPRRLGAADGERDARPGAGRRLRPDHPVELSAPDDGVEDRAGDRARQHRGAEAGGVHPADRDPLRRHLPDGRAAEGGGQHRHRRRRDRRTDRQASRTSTSSPSPARPRSAARSARPRPAPARR